jgi:methionine-rich copper-binding protein CopC
MIDGLTRLRPARWAVLPLAALVVVLGAASASAHANAVRTAPIADAVLVDAPGEVAVWFDASIQPAASGLTLLDRGGRVVAQGRGTAGGERDRVALGLAALDPGTYTAVWDNLSADDGHANAGYYSFSVGRPDPPLVVSPASESWNDAAGRVTLTITPQDDGRQRFEIAALDSRGTPFSNVQRIILRTRLQQPSAGPSSTDAVATPDGRYAVVTGLLGVAGSYDVEVVVRRRRVNDLVAKFSVQAALPPPVAAPAAPGASGA